MAGEQPLGVLSQFKKRYPFFKIGFIGVSVLFDLALAAILIVAPLVRHFLEEGRVDEAIELIDVHGVNAIIQSFVFGLMALDRFLVLAALLGVAGVQRIAHPFQHFVIELQPPEQFGELSLQHLLTDIFSAAADRISLAFIGVAGAMIIDVAFLLDFTDHSAAAGMASDQAGEGEIALSQFGFLCKSPIDHVLYLFPQVDRHQRLMAAVVGLAVPFELSGVNAITQDGVDGAGRNLGAALAEMQARHPRLAHRLLDGNVAARIPLEQFVDQWRRNLIRFDNLAPIRSRHIAIAERCERGPISLLGLFLHALAGLLRQIVDIVLRHQHLDAVHELFRGTRLARENHTFLGEVHLDVQLVHSHPILEVAVEPVRLLDEHRADGRMRFQIADHLAEGSAA